MQSNPQSFYTGLQVKSIADNFTNDSLSLAQLAKINEIGVLQVTALLNIILVDVVLFFEVGKTMGADQVKQTVGLILEDFKHLKPEDLKLCFNRFKKGHYGKLYDRLDGQIILDVLMRYDNERDSEIENIRSRQNRELKNLSAQPLLQMVTEVDNEVFKRNIEKLKSDLAQSKRMRDDDKQQQSKQNTDPVYIMHQRWIMDFHKLRMKQCDRVGMVKKYGVIKNPFFKPNRPNEQEFIPRKMNINEYLNYKQQQYARVIKRLNKQA